MSASNHIENMQQNRPKEHSKVIVFVHGLSGSASTTWGAMAKCVSEDTEFADVEIDYYTYPTKLIRLPFTPPLPGLRDLADGFRTFLEERHSSKKSVLIVAHSLGGVIARQTIVSAFRLGHLKNITKIALIAVPSTGSQLANVGSLISFTHQQLKQLCKDQDGLDSINIDWEQMKVEERIKVKYILGGRDRVVPNDSAAPYIGRDNKALIINADHRSIVSPENDQDIRYKTLRRFLLDEISNSKSDINAPNLAVPRTPDPLFDVYTQKDDPYYIVRSFDNVLSNVIASGHVWLSGDSGIGKSAAARRAVYSSGWKLYHINLSGHEIDNPAALIDAMVSEIAAIADVSSRSGHSTSAEQILSMKKALLAGRSDQIAANLIEEMPIREENLAASANLIAQALEHIDADDRLNGQVRFIFSSRKPISGNFAALDSKAREKIQFLPVETWAELDIARLVRLLAPAIRPDLSERDEQYISSAAKGSPRFVKMMFRHWRNGTSGDQSVEYLCSQVARELVC